MDVASSLTALLTSRAENGAAAEGGGEELTGYHNEDTVPSPERSRAEEKPAAAVRRAGTVPDATTAAVIMSGIEGWTLKEGGLALKNLGKARPSESARKKAAPEHLLHEVGPPGNKWMRNSSVETNERISACHGGDASHQHEHPKET